MKITGAQALIRSLCNHGTEVIFGYPGGQILPIYDALYDCEDVQHILMRHEQGAAHAADAYARATGKVGVCFATSGPGATNLVTGIANAYMDSIPMVAITGQVRTTSLGKDAFQEADITGITMPITKHNYLLKNPKDIARVIAEAFYIASTGRPGPVLVDVPMDVSLAQVDYVPVDKVELRSYKPTIAGHPIQIAKAAKAIAAAERPVIYAGGGVISADASEELVELAERTN
ncbi:MAG TPA: thiamine pyrophosphate-binding protein, partial [Armatimonadota bacterium]|nr:thiamine pyrophosphate-binding protein [Armatimonadota bacterium]